MKRAFTIIELIFVIAIIGLLAAIALPRFISTESNAKFKPALMVTKEIMRKWVEQYHEIQDPNLSKIVLKDPHIQKYLHELTTHIDKHFVWDVREKYDYTSSPPTVFAIGYKSYKEIPGNVYYSKPGGGTDSTDPKPDGTPLPVDDKYIEWFSGTPASRRTRGVKNCIQVKMLKAQIPLTVDHNVTVYELNLSKVDPTCMQVE